MTFRAQATLLTLSSSYVFQSSRSFGRMPAYARNVIRERRFARVRQVGTRPRAIWNPPLAPVEREELHALGAIHAFPKHAADVVIQFRRSVNCDSLAENGDIPCLIAAHSTESSVQCLRRHRGYVPLVFRIMQIRPTFQ